VQPDVLLARVRASEDKLREADQESRLILLHLEERRRRAELNTSTMSLNRLDKLSNHLATMKKTVGTVTSIAVRNHLLLFPCTHVDSLYFMCHLGIHQMDCRGNVAWPRCHL
jgi:hypothetical protein